jgi:D-beta-D-heptose 7-phosphate kinase/D-beta-D-heptose 1-phosphate adenosyltransferase
MTVWTNGCFDVLHSGHVAMLEYAKSLGDKLVVGLDTDSRVKANKGLDRPIHTLEQRMSVIGALRCVDNVVSFSNEIELVNHIRESGASIIVVGSDYKDKRVIGSDIARVLFYERVPNLSSTRVINEIRF